LFTLIAIGDESCDKTFNGRGSPKINTKSYRCPLSKSNFPSNLKKEIFGAAVYLLYLRTFDILITIELGV